MNLTLKTELNGSENNEHIAIVHQHGKRDFHVTGKSGCKLVYRDQNSSHCKLDCSVLFKLFGGNIALWKHVKAVETLKLEGSYLLLT